MMIQWEIPPVTLAQGGTTPIQAVAETTILCLSRQVECAACAVEATQVVARAEAQEVTPREEAEDLPMVEALHPQDHTVLKNSCTESREFSRRQGATRTASTLFSQPHKAVSGILHPFAIAKCRSPLIIEIVHQYI